MNLTPRSINVYPFCAGCLSSDRILKNLENWELRVLLCTFLCDATWLQPPYHPLPVCFECKAVLLRFRRFQKQAKCAHNAFQSFLNNGLRPECLSKLSTKNIATYNIESNDTFYLKNEDLSDDTIDKNVSNSNKKETNVASEIKKLNDSREHDKIEPVFVKMEAKVEELFLVDDFQNDDIENEEIDIKPEASFQDSDDEPLCEVKKKKHTKKKKHKRVVKNSVKPLQEECSRVVYNPRVERILDQLNVERGQMEMVVLSWDEVESERQEALKSPPYTRMQYQCEDCALGFNHRAKLAAHRDKHDAAAGAVACNVCTIRFKNEKSLYAHRRRHRVRWRCSPCGRLWSRAGVCADHLHRAHGGAAPAHTCPHCDHTAPTLGKLKLHMRSHSEPVSCEICGKTYRDKDTLRTHLFIHRGEKEYACTICEKRFLFKKALEIHELTHGERQNLYCHQCDVTFKNYLSYYQHMKYNMKHIGPDQLMHSCGECGRRFARASRLREHERVAHGHERERDVRCTHQGCHKTFKSRGSLRSHRASAHRRDLARTHTHVCHTCGHKYKSKKSLEGHMRTHSGARPYACACAAAGCAATFAHLAALYRHHKQVHHMTMTTKKKQTSETVVTNTTPE